MAIRYSLFAFGFWLTLGGLAALREKIFWLLAFAWRLGGLAAWREKIFWLLAFALRLGGLARNIFTARLHKNIKKGT